MIVCSFNRRSLLGNEQRLKFKEEFASIDLPWSPLSPLSPSRPSLPGTPLCPGSPGMPGCPQTQPLLCVCSCATHLTIQRRSSRVQIQLICNITIIVHKIKVRLMLRSRLWVKPYWIVNGWIFFRQKTATKLDGNFGQKRPWDPFIGLTVFSGLLIELSVIHHQCLSRIVKANNKNRLWAHVTARGTKIPVLFTVYFARCFSVWEDKQDIDSF